MTEAEVMAEKESLGNPTDARQAKPASGRAAGRS